MEKKLTYTDKCLSDGFDVVFLMHDQLCNVIASDGERNASKEDKKYRNKAARFIKWYQQYLKTRA